MIHRLLLLSSLLVACAPMPKPSDPRDISGINPAFASYVQEFEVMYGHPIGDIPIQFAPLSGYTIGECVVWTGGWREIKIDPDWWNYEAIDDDQRESIIAHELGHGVLNRGHITGNYLYTSLDGLSQWQMPISLMYPDVFFSDWLEDWQTLKVYYYNELFHPSPGYPLLGETSADEDFIHMDVK